RILHRIADIIESRDDLLAEIETWDSGLPITQAKGQAQRAAENFRFFADLIVAQHDNAFKVPGRQINYVNRKPIGVAGLITPWNVPFMQESWKLAPALATGNTVVLKPAETTPLTALLFADLLQQAELPPGVVNIVTGAGPTGAAVVGHPGVDKVAFTGSTAVGKSIAKQIAGTRKHATLELGGKAANIVFADAPIDQAVEGIVNGIFFNQGQVCCAGSRVLVEEPLHDELVDRLKARLGTLRLGDPMDKNTDIGAINSARQLERITDLSAAGEAEGAVRWSADCAIPESGFWFPPTVFTQVSAAHRIAREEIFGPVLSVLTFRTPAEAVAKANNTPYGLSAGIWTEKGSRILWMADRLRAGVVWANTFNKFDPTSPFGGYKESGYGREGGRQGLGPYLVEGDVR
ncbi:MAG TPA: aldehyde dehydrogenase family protein, partial [Actinotalea caeni]|uniref:aldehyde dehydrogenase family protein n=1 Tax=Actinotalea caeni TaxID=1348467 RepID=UPI002B4B38E6